MALEELVGEQEVNEIAGRPFGINPLESYDRPEFVERARELFKVEGYNRRLVESKGTDINAWNKLVRKSLKYMPGDRNQNMIILSDLRALLDQADVLLDAGYESMAWFVSNHRNSLLRKLSAEQLYNLFSRAPLYKTGDKEHDRVRDLREKVIRIQEASKRGEDVGSVVQRELYDLIERVPQEQKIYIMRNQHLVIPSLTKALLGSIQKAFGSLFRDEKGNVNRSELERYLIRNYKVVEDYIDDLPSDVSDEERQDYWNDNIKPQYVEIARELYGVKKPEQERKDNPNKEDRKEYAMGVGLAA